MKQVVKLFTSYNTSIDIDINKFLEEHPNYTIDRITLDTRSGDALIIALIVFNVKEPTNSKAIGYDLNTIKQHKIEESEQSISSVKSITFDKIEAYLYKELRPYCSCAQIDNVLDRLMEDLR
jgi:hypothetical protein